MPMDLEAAKNTVINSDNMVVLTSMPNNCIDSIITDPPYGLSFMGKKWDYDVPSIETWAECLRVLKPGGTLLCFAGSRTQHRMAVNIEDAGFIIKDTLMWLYGSGFPKAHNFTKDLDSELWDGYKSHGLKPAYEPIILSMKPNEGSYADNAKKYGVAGLNIAECRIEAADMEQLEKNRNHFEKLDTNMTNTGKGFNDCNRILTTHNVGRFPANILLECTCDKIIKGGQTKPQDPHRFDRFNLFGKDSGPRGEVNIYSDTIIHHTDPNCPCRILDEQSGISKTGDIKPFKQKTEIKFGKLGENRNCNFVGDTGGASRFFYVAKVSKSERNYGCDNIEGNNIHPTLKPVTLMEYLCRLTKTPTGGIVLDPFGGSGTTGIGCILTGRDYIRIEQSEEYCRIAEARLKAWKEKPKENNCKKKKEKTQKKKNKNKVTTKTTKTLWDAIK